MRKKLTKIPLEPKLKKEAKKIRIIQLFEEVLVNHIALSELRDMYRSRLKEII